MVDRSSPMPLWAQIDTDLRARIAAGEFDAGFPTDLELVEHYGVSRHTVRDALRRLTTEGLIERERGRGTRLARSVISQPTGAIYSLFETIETQGMRQHSIVRELDRRTDPVAAHDLGLTDDADLVYIERVRLADDDPIAHDRVWLPAQIAAPLLDCDFTHTSVYRELAERCGFGPEGGSETIRPHCPTAGEADLLEAPEHTPMFVIERRTHAHERPLEVRTTLIRGDCYTFVADWELGGAYEPHLVHTLEPTSA